MSHDDQAITQPLPLHREPPPNDEKAAPVALPSDQDEIRTPPPLSQNEISTPPPFPSPSPFSPSPVPPFVEPPRSAGRGTRLVASLALIIALASLALNAVLIYNLLTLRQAAADGLDSAIAALDNLEGTGFHYEYHFSQTIPFEGDIPIKQDFVFPFKGNFPIKTTVEVPIDAGVLGTIVVKVPIDTNIPVDVEVPIKLDQTVHVSTEIPLNMTFPIDIRADDPAIQELLVPVRAWLVQLREVLK